MRIAITGASGLIGTALCSELADRGDEPIRIGRSAATADVVWDPANEKLDSSELEGSDAVVHLAGESIAAGRWTDGRKRRMKESRVQGTEFLSRRLAQLQRPPQVLVSASAIGYYGDQGDAICDDDGPLGDGFLPDLCNAWEMAVQPARDTGIRVVTVRIGIVLSRHGGALAKMLLPFKLCLGGRVGSGRQYWSWIGVPDLVGAIVHAIETPSLSGVVNGVAGTLTNLEFTKALGRALKRPTIFPLPAFVARCMLGQMADELLLASARVVTNKLPQSGFKFAHDDLDVALQVALR